MKKTAVILIFAMIFAVLFSVPACALSAKSAVVINGDTGEVLYSENADCRMPMASTTKIMTALLLCENADLGKSITVTKEMVTVEGSSMGLLPGDSVTFSDLLYGMMLASGNDAANTVAVAIGGTAEKFADMMNGRAAQMGLKDTHFVTPSGLDADGHYTTAYELALIAREAMKNESFAKAAASESATLCYGNPPYRRTLSNHNKLLKMYDGAVGVKTGFTKKSGRCLVSAAKRDGKYVIAVTLHDPNDWSDHKNLLDLGLSAVKTVTATPEKLPPVSVINGKSEFVGTNTEKMSFCVASPELLYTKYLLPTSVYAPVRAGQTVGSIEYYYKDECICSQKITAECDCNSVKMNKKARFIALVRLILSKI